jgi:phosphate-selective porin OprO and OprP
MQKTMQWVTMLVVIAVAASALGAGVKYANDKGQYVKLGGRIQLQYHMTDPDGGESSDELLFRRFRPFIEGSVHEDWKGKFQWDMGKGDLAVKDAYFQYSGFDMMKVGIGNMNFPFSRELLTSSKYQQLVERTFVGDHNYGTADRQAGIHLSGDGMDGMLAWAVSGAKAAIDPDNKKLDFDTVIQFDKGGDWIEGEMVGGRLEFSPLGTLKHSQGDFDRESKVAFAVGAFSWQNDDDDVATDDEGLPNGKNVDDVTGLEISGAVRGMGFSVDAQYNTFDAELKDGGAGVDGIYENGETTLENMAVEGGYMVVPSKLEVVGGWQSQDADGYAETWTRTSVGLNWFVKKHDIKYQVTYRMNENKDGKDGADVDELFVQAQYVF